ncbi:MAG TPA: HTTM domain-containing protein [Bdellovibrionota bacterium]|jgi:hypothetical protein|nr:HTTM domain-containing protein [Bdellovibrionota bacterium]
MSILNLFRAINRWFFESVDTWGLAIFRITLGLVAINKILFLYPELVYWYSNEGIVSLTTSFTSQLSGGLNLFYTLRDFDSVTVAYTLWTLSLVSATTFTLGLGTRVSAFVLYVLIVSFDHRNTYVLQGGDALIRVMLFWMIFARSNGYHSVDRAIAQAKARTLPTQQSAWPLRALQIQLALMYLGTFLHKSEGPTWWDGSAVYIVSQLIDFNRYPLPLAYANWTFVKLMTWGAFLFEFLFPLLIWFRETRRYLLVFGIVFHLILEWHISIPIFQVASLASYAVFLERKDWEDLKRLTARLRRRQV